MSYETVIWEQSDGVGRITLNRPETLNAWTAAFGRDLKQVVTGDATDSSVRAVLVTGAGRGFPRAPISRPASTRPTTACPTSARSCTSCTTP